MRHRLLAPDDPASRAAPVGAPRARGDFLLPALGYAILVLVLLWPRLALLATHLPRTPNEYDAQLIAWILSWVGHALVDPAATVLDANINHPAPAQLTGSDYFLSPQLLFAPLHWITGNVVLALNVTALALFWLAGFCCERLLRALGCAPLIAFVGGAAYLLGTHTTPFNVHILQYPPFLLPALALALTRLRETPDLRRAAVLCVVFGCALLCSAYAAMLAGVTAAVWALAELARPLPRRMRFVALGLVAAAIGFALLFPLASAYLARAATQNLPPPPSGRDGGGLPDLAYLKILLFHLPIELALQLIGLTALAGVLTGVAAARRIVAVALACMLAGSMLMPGVPPALRDTVAGELFRAVRYPHRFAIVTDFGAALLLAAGMSTLAAWLPQRLRRAPALLALVLLLLGRSLLDGGGMREVAALGRDRSVHRAVAEIVAAEGRGAMLMLPNYGVADGGHTPTELLQPDAMLASTVHWLPLVDGYTGHQPPHRLLLKALLGALPDAAALADLVDMTHLRWILLRPAALWPADQPRQPFERALRAAPDIGRAWEVDGWTLLEVVREPQHESWFAAIAAGPRLDATVLGTPVAPLPPGSDRGVVAARRQLPAQLQTKQLLVAPIAVHNTGSATWPVSRVPTPGLILDIALSTVPLDDTVVLVERWTRLDGPGTDERRNVRLRRDVSPGETLQQQAILVTPQEPGRYRLELSLAQIGGADFTAPGNVRLEHEMVVVPGAGAKRPPPTLPPAD